MRRAIVGLLLCAVAATWFIVDLRPVSAGENQIASVACSQWRWGIGDDKFKIYTGWEDLHDDFTDTNAQGGGDILRWLDPNGSYWQSVYSTTTGDEVAVVWMLCIQGGDTITIDNLNTVHDLIRERWPTQPIYVVPLDVKRPDPCNNGEYDQSVQHRDWILENFAGTFLGPELTPTLAADETHDGCHPNQAGIDRYSTLLAEWVPAMQSGTTVTSGRFYDDNGSTHEGYIEAIAEAGITLGCDSSDPGRFCPDDPVTRGQMASFLTRAFDLPSTTTDYFTDDDGSTHEANINAIAQAGITLGCSAQAADQFCPNDLVSRAQMASFLDRALTLPSTTTDFFVDDDGLVHEAAINRIALDEITLGCFAADPTLFCPYASVTRGQMASFLGRALDLAEIVP